MRENESFSSHCHSFKNKICLVGGKSSLGLTYFNSQGVHRVCWNQASVESKCFVNYFLNWWNFLSSFKLFGTFPDLHTIKGYKSSLYLSVNNWQNKVIFVSRYWCHIFVEHWADTWRSLLFDKLHMNFALLNWWYWLKSSNLSFANRGWQLESFFWNEALTAVLVCGILVTTMLINILKRINL